MGNPMSDASISLTRSEVRRRIDDFVREYLSSNSPATVGTYRRSLSEFERYIEKGEGRFEFSTESVAAYKEYLASERQLHEVSVSTYLTAVRRLCQYLVDIGLLATNPARLVKGNRRPTSHSREVLTQTEIDQLLSVMRPESMLDKRDHAMIFLMLYAGLSEIELIRADVGDLEQTLLGWFLRVQGKGRTDKDQQVPIDPPVMNKLRLYFDTRSRIRPNDPLIVSHGHRSEGKRLNTRSVRSRINLYLEAAGIKRPGISPHSLTHTAALIWLNDGVSVEEVRRRMRHGTLDTTLIYLRQQGELSSSPGRAVPGAD